jgi:hypothetical protein
MAYGLRTVRTARGHLAQHTVFERREKKPMSSTTYSEFEDWLPRPAALGLALGLWITGFAVAGAVVWRLHDAASGPTFTAMSPEMTRPPANATASGAVIVIPEDLVVGHRTPRTGVTMRQKP